MGPSMARIDEGLYSQSRESTTPCDRYEDGAPRATGEISSSTHRKSTRCRGNERSGGDFVETVDDTTQKRVLTLGSSMGIPFSIRSRTRASNRKKNVVDYLGLANGGMGGKDRQCKTISTGMRGKSVVPVLCLGESKEE
ncbi:hypothetical protein SOVF_116140 [Spinacia oleracea]|nr:hypothetical protein SOVF_116140 [Spinacia oleracea]